MRGGIDHDFALTIPHVLRAPIVGRSSAEIVDADGTRYGYPELVERVGRLASALGAAGIARGETVAVMDWDSHRYLEAYFAIPAMGCVLQTVNIRLSPTQVAYTLGHARAAAIIAHEDFLPLLAEIADRLPCVRAVLTIGAVPPGLPAALPVAGDLAALTAAASPDPRPVELDERETASIFYTSGTTGNPKGVYYSHRQLVLHTLGLLATFGTRPMQGRFAADDVYMPITPLFHAHAWGFPFAATMLGIKQVYPGRYQPDLLLRLIAREDVTFSHCVATILQMMLDHPAAAEIDLSGLKLLIGGGALSEGLARRAIARGIDVFGGYGMSETGPVQVINHLTPAELARDAADQAALRTRTGRPVLLCEVMTVNPDMTPTGEDAPGEIVFRSPWLTAGYHDDPEGSAMLWEGGWLHSNDIGAFDRDGVLRISDRLKDVVKTGGEWVSSLLLESLISQVPGVAEVAVIGVPDERWGERPLALVVPREGGATDDAAIRRCLSSHADAGAIPRYAVPDRVLFVDSLEKTSVGKLDKKRLRGRYA